MDINSSPIWNEVSEIVDSGPNPIHNLWSCILITNDKHVEPLKLISIDGSRSYTTKYADEITITIQLEIKDFNAYLSPNKDDFKVMLFKSPIGELDDGADFNEVPISRTYRGALLSVGDAVNDSAIMDSNSSTDSNDEPAGHGEYTIQLIDLAIEQLRMKTLGGIYRNMTTTEMLQGAMSIVSGQLSLDVDDSIIGVDIVPGNNVEVRDHIVVPHGTPAITLADYIQRECGGVYGAGIGCYLQNRIWYIYPEYDIVRYEDTPKTLTILNKRIWVLLTQ